jgi:hypothetical protein
MTRSRTFRALAEGAALHTAVTVVAFGALTAWARHCERHR